MLEDVKKNDKFILRTTMGHNSIRKYEEILIKSVSAGGKISVEKNGEILKFDMRGYHKNRSEYSSTYYTLLPDNEETKKEIEEHEKKQEFLRKVRFLESFHDWKRLDESVVNAIIEAIQQQGKE